jgi:isocitrate dehydrogenase
MIQNAWLKTLEDGIHTADIYKAEVSSKKVGTNEFAQAVIERLGQEPQQLKAVKYKKTAGIQIKPYQKRVEAKKELIGVDIFVCWNGTNANEIGEKIAPLTHKNIELSMISNRGIKVWPNGFDETFCTDHWRCRYKSLDGSTISQGDIIALLTLFNQHQIEVIKTENLYTFDGKIGFSLGQGQ